MSDISVSQGQADHAVSISEASVRDYYELLKPRVMQLVIFTSLVGLLLAPGSIHPVIAIAAILCVAVGAGAAGALNMWYEADIDAVMKRTRARPIPAGKVTPEEALAFGLVLSVISVFTMALLVNYVAAGLLAFTIAFYVLFYTMWLKRRTPQNIVIGGAAGAIAPMIGWAAVTGSVGIEQLILFAIVFMWTPPHFWALSLYRAGDYEKVGVPMMVVVAGKASTRWQMLIYAILFVAITLLPTPVGFAGPIYLATAALFGLGFVYHAIKVWRFGQMADGVELEGQVRKVAQVKADHAARAMFHYSNWHLFALFLVLLIESIFGLDAIMMSWLS